MFDIYRQQLLNDDKTELLLVNSKYRQMLALLPVLVGNEMIMRT